MWNCELLDLHRKCAGAQWDPSSDVAVRHTAAGVRFGATSFHTNFSRATQNWTNNRTWQFPLILADINKMPDFIFTLLCFALFYMSAVHTQLALCFRRLRRWCRLPFVDLSYFTSKKRFLLDSAHPASSYPSRWRAALAWKWTLKPRWKSSIFGNSQRTQPPPQL